MTLQPHEERVFLERSTLVVNLDEINFLIDGDAWQKMDEIDRDLIIQQRNHMTAYLGVLQRRAARFLSRAR